MMDAEDRELLARSLAHAVEAAGSGEALDAALADLGWHDAVAADPRTATSLLFDLQGRAGAVSSALDDVLASALGVEVGSVAVVLPPLGAVRPPGRAADPAVLGLGTGALARRGTAVVVTEDDEKLAALMVPVDALALRPIGGLDPALGLVEVTAATLPDAERLDVPPTAWDAAVAAARRALAHELVGTSRAMLTLARDHAVERIQFGRPIAAFQAVRHRLAETLVAVEAADAALDAAWNEPSPSTAVMAKALAGRAGRTTARHCQQVLAGIGFTTDHQLHRYVRRAIVLDELLGSTRTLTAELGAGILASGHLPELPAL